MEAGSDLVRNQIVPLGLDAAVQAAPLTRYYPSEDGIPLDTIMDAWRAVSMQMAFLGGRTAAPADVTATLTVEGTDGLVVAGNIVWENISAAVLDTTTGSSGTTGWTSVGAVGKSLLLCLGNPNLTHVRVKVVWDAAPDGVAGAFLGRARLRDR